MAGLAAAERLGAAGRRVVVLEARDRIGGRIHTVDDPGLDHPVELGAEFVHGRPAELVELIRDTGLTLEAVSAASSAASSAPAQRPGGGAARHSRLAGDAARGRPRRPRSPGGRPHPRARRVVGAPGRAPGRDPVPRGIPRRRPVADGYPGAGRERIGGGRRRRLACTASARGTARSSGGWRNDGDHRAWRSGSARW